MFQREHFWEIFAFNRWLNNTSGHRLVCWFKDGFIPDKSWSLILQDTKPWSALAHCGTAWTVLPSVDCSSGHWFLSVSDWLGDRSGRTSLYLTVVLFLYPNPNQDWHSFNHLKAEALSSYRAVAVTTVTACLPQLCVAFRCCHVNHKHEQWTAEKIGFYLSLHYIFAGSWLNSVQTQT